MAYTPLMRGDIDLEASSTRRRISDGAAS